VAESFATPAAFHKAQAEGHEYQRLQKLCADLVAVNQRICRLRPVEKPAQQWSAEEKKNGCCDPSRGYARIRRSVAAHLHRTSQDDNLDLEAVELVLRTALHSTGAVGLSELLREPGPMFRHVLDGAGRQRRNSAPLLPSQPSV